MSPEAWQTATVALLILGTAAVVVYDVLACRYGGPEATVSLVVSGWCYRWPLIPLAAGILIGHLIAPLRTP